MQRNITEKIVRTAFRGGTNSTILCGAQSSTSRLTPAPASTLALSTLARRRRKGDWNSGHRSYSLAPKTTGSSLSSSYCHDRAKLEMWKRGFHSSRVTHHTGVERPEPGTGIKIHFKDSKGNLIKTVEANEGDDLLSIAHEYDIDLEGACERSVACSTCHVILEPEIFDQLPEPEDDENDMLDMAFGLTDTSRLGCQVYVKKELDGMSVMLPSATRNMFVDGKKPTRH
ncbi:ferredoxin [Marasmius fiardii PR-910]|nr:ferredoxin [Marasmius fiardii PR-910]